MDIVFLNSITEIDANKWDALWPTDYPFTRHAFLHCLEASASINDNEHVRDTGWQPRHLIVKEEGTVLLAMPMFEKDHSYGEYVFDWSWANAYAQAGLNYYPKLLCGIPFTPSTGPRVGLHPSVINECDSVFAAAIDAIKRFIAKQCMSGFHCLFPAPNEVATFSRCIQTKRDGYQFHWFNQNYRDFDDFLAQFNSRKRKSVRRERKKIAEQNIRVQMREAKDVSQNEWDFFYALYHRTYLKRSGSTGYLGKSFFHRLAQAFPHQVLLASAHVNDEFVAAALYLRDKDTLYGRYWGTKLDMDGLHFEACYYQGIEYAIRHGLKRFDPGAQGEHKIQRGFTPIKTCSFHWLAQPEFDNAIRDFVKHESREVEHYIHDARHYLPFKAETEVVPMEVLLGGDC